MEEIRQISEKVVQDTSMHFKRYLLEKINWKNRLTGISGARGSGKTTLILQYFKSKLHGKHETIYVSLDNIRFSQKKLVGFAGEFSKKGGKYLLLDEVHKYPDWSQEIKNIYDSYPELNIVFTSSSALEIHKGSHDLSRRLMLYQLEDMSFREYLELIHNIKLPVYKFEQIIKEHSKITADLLKEFKPLKYFEEYLRQGCYPFITESPDDYHERLLNIINTVLESDLPAIHRVDFASVIKMKKLLMVLPDFVPYSPNIQKLASLAGTSRDSLLKYLYYLNKAKIVKHLTKNAQGINFLNKPEKLFLHNTNLMYALSQRKPDQGNLRETFFFNQVSAMQTVTFPSKADFLVNEKYLFEVGGKNKTQKQISGSKHAYIAKDDIEYGYENVIPLWLFGLMY